MFVLGRGVMDAALDRVYEAVNIFLVQKSHYMCVCVVFCVPSDGGRVRDYSPLAP